MVLESSPSDNHCFPIRELSARTRVNTVTLRAWERRYGLLKPKRTDKGHRLYSEADVKRVEQILAWTSRGVPVSKVRALLEQRHAADPVAIAMADPAGQSQQLQGLHWTQQVDSLLDAVSRFSAQGVQKILADAFLQYPAELCARHLLEPAMAALQSEAASRGQWLFLQSEILHFTSLRLDLNRKQSQGSEICLLCGPNTPLWRLALMGIQLADSNHLLLFFNQRCNVDAWLQVASANSDRCCIVYQDGSWRDDELERIKTLLPVLPGLQICGAAPMMAGLTSADRCFATPQQLLEHFWRLQKVQKPA
ncbi:MAG: MerR family transcriptional regulator [Gammaproteobacteria bacterium]|uniref:MerR family transcriptional regulator n=1 Tax=Pseudomaricurvus alcaniphilus TaxID=1166482 RepID=UPI00140967C8|nr:MerR family transcriptional regulator [Pseudomaricurvus alcaniphilus]MBR9909630.1 MerR family transcriptional regulator [Gammaproteobacteria bacterium]NHN36954.1 MerR family transcriptional regulator [Pseudomaricurvus alcaniphilus]